MEIPILFIGLRQMHKVEANIFMHNSNAFFYEVTIHWKEIKNRLTREIIDFTKEIIISNEELDAHNIDATVLKCRTLLIFHAEALFFQQATDLQKKLENNISKELHGIRRLAITFDQLLLSATSHPSLKNKPPKRFSKSLKSIIDQANKDLSNPKESVGRMEVSLGIYSLMAELQKMRLDLTSCYNIKSFQNELLISTTNTLDRFWSENQEKIENDFRSHINFVYGKTNSIILNFLDQAQNEINP